LHGLDRPDLGSIYASNVGRQNRHSEPTFLARRKRQQRVGFFGLAAM
jgi:hypothetical protein